MRYQDQRMRYQDQGGLHTLRLLLLHNHLEQTLLLVVLPVCCFYPVFQMGWERHRPTGREDPQFVLPGKIKGVIFLHQLTEAMIGDVDRYFYECWTY